MKKNLRLFTALISIILIVTSVGACGNNNNNNERSESDSSVSESGKDEKKNARKAYYSLCYASERMDKLAKVTLEAWYVGAQKITNDIEKMNLLIKRTGLTGSSGEKLIELRSMGNSIDTPYECIKICKKVLLQDDDNYTYVKTNIDDAKECIQKISSDFDGYKDLKGFYSTASSFYDWLDEPTGTYENSVEMVADYQKELKKYKNDLEFDYGK